MNADTYVCFLVVEAMAVQATIEGMKAENQHWVAQNQGPAWMRVDFDREAATLHSLAESLRSRAS